MYEPVKFMQLFLAPYLEFEQRKGHVALHVPCTSKQAGLTDNFVQLASRCSKEVSLTGGGPLAIVSDAISYGSLSLA